MLVFLCPVVTCGKTFSSKRNIYEHIIHIHLRLKSYQCTYCSHNFTTFNAAKHHLKKFHTIESQTESMTNVRIIYNISFLNTEEAIQRVTTAFYNQDFRSSILRPNGIGLQLTEELEKKLIQISKDTSYGVIRKKRISNSTRVKENPHFPMTCIKNHSKSHSISNNVKNTMEKIHVDIKGFKETPANKNLCLHKRKRHLKS
jgi:NAD-dependent SIR2 family protein deacetylase